MNRALDDFAGGLGHQASHAGELADLLLGSSSAGVGHDQYRIQLTLVLLDAVHFDEHRLGNLLGYIGPDRYDFVIAFAVGDDALLVLLFDFGNIITGRLYQLDLARRSDQVIDSN